MTSTTSPKAGPPTPPDSDLLTPAEIEALREQNRELGRRVRESMARLKAAKAAKERERQHAQPDSGSTGGDDGKAPRKDSGS
jgi:hypothetical protein